MPIQSEEFMQIVLTEEPDKVQLNFCIGLINYNHKKDFLAAERDFTAFLHWDRIQEFPFAKDLAEGLVSRCREHLIA